MLFVFIVRRRENQFNVEESEHNVEKMTVKLRLPAGMCQRFNSQSKALVKYRELCQKRDAYNCKLVQIHITSHCFPMAYILHR